jgi:pectinesterase
MIFLSHFEPREKKIFVIANSNKKPEPVQPLTGVRYMLPREDVAWENDRIAHRIYGPAQAKDVNNGIDVWTKRVRYPIIEKWYRGDEAPDSIRISYHEDHGEGADFFNVGRTLGAGSCALFFGDSLYQPGVFASYKILATGPIRAMFEVSYNPVRFGDKNILEVRRITLDAGNNLSTIGVTYRCDSSTGTVSFAAGIVKRKGVVSTRDSTHRWVSLWGPTNEKEENGSLGTGIVMTKRTYTGIKENDVHVLMLGTIELGKTATYYTGAGWTRSGDFSTSEEWNVYLKKFAQRIESPLGVSVTIAQ